MSTVEKVGTVTIAWSLIGEFLPPGTEIVSLAAGFDPKTLVLTIRHPDLDPITEGELIPHYQAIGLRVETHYEKVNV